MNKPCYHSPSGFFISALLSTLLFFSVMPFNKVHAEIEPLESIIAIVEDDVILKSQLEQRMQTLTLEFHKAGRTLPSRELFRKEVLEQLILEKIELQLAQLNGIRVDDATLSGTMEKIAAQNNKSLADFKLMVEEEGMNYKELRERIRNDMTLNILRQRMITNRISVTEQDVKNFLNSPDGQTQLSAAYRLGHILISNSNAQSEQDALALSKKLSDGADFLSEAEKFSPNADLGWRKIEQLPTLFIDPVKKMKLGEVSAPIKSESGYHIIKLLDKQGGDHKIVAQTRARHILIKPNEVRSGQDSLHMITDIRNQIINGKSFAEMARTYSEDPVSANDGGDLNWASPGDYVPQFEAVMNQLPIGEVSEPFVSGFGWHILEVMERREHNIGKEFQMNQARSVLQQQQFENELQLWLREVRQNAFVDIKS